ncbi:MAG TPA: IS110 family transposase [Pyrinomonadaceae bacterium]
MEVVVLVGAGLDVHKKKIVACCLDGRSSPPAVVTCTFGTFTEDLRRLRDWLVKRECTHVAMESTGVYWLPVYRVLEGSVQLVLGNAKHIKNVPGRKTDITDAHWIAKLLRHGLIEPNFVPPSEIRELRQTVRFRRKLIHMLTSSQLRVEKLLQTTNIKLSSVASEVFGVSGRLMLASLAKGETDPVKLANLAKGKLRNKIGDLTHAFTGSFTKNDARLLEVELDVVHDLETQLDHLQTLIEEKVKPHAELIERLDTIPGVNHILAIDLIAEIGTTVKPWTNDRRFVAWTGTCPGNRESAGIRRPARSREGNPYIKTVLIQAAVCASRMVASSLAARYRRLSGRRGKNRAIVAVAREIAVAIYFMIERQQNYVPPKHLDPKTARKQKVTQLLNQLKKLGVEVTTTTTTE